MCSPRDVILQAVIVYQSKPQWWYWMVRQYAVNPPTVWPFNITTEVLIDKLWQPAIWHLVVNTSTQNNTYFREQNKCNFSTLYLAFSGRLGVHCHINNDRFIGICGETLTKSTLKLCRGPSKVPLPAERFNYFFIASIRHKACDWNPEGKQI